FFALWREAMLKTVRASDPLCDEEILTAWAMAIAPGLEYLRRQAELHYQTAGH
ncbi:globin, partial [Klebsiella pneumoniae]|nr:globin [Klebsiella pneumoniae]